MALHVGANIDVTLSEFAGRLTPLAIGWLMGPAAAGLYAVAQRATAVIAQPAQLLGQAAYAELAHLVAGGGRETGLRTVLLRAVAVALLAAAPICLLLAVFGERLAVLIGGEGFAAAGAIMIWLAVARSVQLAAPPMSAALTAMGRPGLSVWANAVGGGAALLVLPPLVQSMGLAGAGVQALVQALLVVGLLTFAIVQSTDSPALRAQRVEA